MEISECLVHNVNYGKVHLELQVQHAIIEYSEWIVFHLYLNYKVFNIYILFIPILF